MNNRKGLKLFLIFALLFMVLSFAFGCGKGNNENNPNENDPNQGDPNGNQRTNAEIAESAMNNFMNNLKTKNYVIDFKDHITINVYSDDLVDFKFGDDYGLGFGDEIAYDEMAVVTINNNETFNVFFGEDNHQLCFYVNEGKAKELVTFNAGSDVIATRLFDYWIDSATTEENIWNLFTNYDEKNPLTFIATDYYDIVKETMQIIGGLGEYVMGRMQDIYLEFEDESANIAHFKTSFSAGLTPVPDIDIVITFGNAVASEKAVAWMNDDTREYPDAKDEWDAIDEMHLNAVFLPPYGVIAVPFPDFASYAFMFNISVILSDDEIDLRDPKATEADLASYIAKLETEGFTRAENEYGETVYRKLLREEYKCYSEIYLEYNNGVNIVAKKYYDFDTYEGLDAINNVLSRSSFPVLQASSHFNNLNAVDTKEEMTESWLYFFDYDLVLYVNAKYDEFENMDTYVNRYIKQLTDSGYTLAYGEDEEYDEGDFGEFKACLGEEVSQERRFTELMDSDNYYKLQTADGLRTFRYIVDDIHRDITLLFKYESYILENECETALSEAGFPDIDIPTENFASCRDFILFSKTMYYEDFDLDLSLALEFDLADGEEESSVAKAYLDDLFDNVLIPAGFSLDLEGEIEWSRKAVFYKAVEESGKTTRLIVGLNYLLDLSYVNLEFRIEVIE